jgi:hypothetical protein
MSTLYKKRAACCESFSVTPPEFTHINAQGVERIAVEFRSCRRNGKMPRRDLQL